MFPFMNQPLILRISRAKQIKDETIEVSVDEIENILSHSKVLDERLSNCMEIMTQEQLNAVFGDLFSGE